MRWRPAAVLVAMGVALAQAARAGGPDALGRVEARGALRWGGDVQGGEPYVFQDPGDGRLAGFEVEIADAVARRLGVRAEFAQNDWQHLVPALERGDCDVILNGFEVRAAHAGRVVFTRPYYVFGEVLVVRAADAARVRSLGQLRGRRVGTLGGSLAHELLGGTAGLDVVLYEGDEEPYLDLEQKRLDAVLLDDVIAIRHGLTRPGLRAVAEVGEGRYAAAVLPGEERLRAAVDGALAGMIAGGELRAILERWQLWNARQERLAVAADSAAVLPARRVITTAHARLFLRAAGITLLVSALAMGLAVAGGIALSVLRREGGPLAAVFVTAYTELFRGTPVLLQLYVLYYGLAPVLALDPFVAAVLGLGLNYAAYEAEIYRAGLEAVPAGQTEAAVALGFSRLGALRHVVLPQAARVALPGVANDFIALLKDSSLVSVITVVELTKQMTITAVDFRGWLVPGALCAGLYLAMSLPLARLARRLERRLGAVRP